LWILTGSLFILAPAAGAPVGRALEFPSLACRRGL